MLARGVLRLVDPLSHQQHRQEDVADQCALAAAADAGDHGDEAADGMRTSMLRRLCSRAPFTSSHSRPGLTCFGSGIDFLPARYSRRSILDLEDLDRTAVDHVAAVAGTRADVDDPVGFSDRLFVVLDDQHRVAEVAQPEQVLDEPADCRARCRPIDGSSRTYNVADQARADEAGQAHGCLVPPPASVAAERRRG